MWKKLTVDDLKNILSQDEIDRLDTLSLDDENLNKIIDSTIELVSNVWRGALSAKGVIMDVRDYYIPPEYQYWVLVHSRHAVWTRFPNSSVIALDEARKDEYTKALELLKDPYIGCSKPDYADLPEEDRPKDMQADPSIIVPPLKFDSWYGYNNVLNNTGK